MNTDSEAERIWTSCAQNIRSQVSDAVWRTTFSGARATAFDQGSIRFHRDASGRVVELSTYGGRVYDMRFQRVER